MINACTSDSEQQYIQSLGIVFDRYDATTGKAGDLIFVAADDKPFIEFGKDMLTDASGEKKDNAAFEYHVDPATDILAVADGTVTRMTFQDDTGDYEISIKTAEKFIAIYDHILDPHVAKGDTVTAGDVLGKPGAWSPEIGRTELQINDPNKNLSYCPFDFFDPKTIDTYKEKVMTLIHDWEAFKGNDTIYDETKYIQPGCTAKTVIP
jgi:hypothetical protein